MNYIQHSYMFISGFSFMAGALFLHVFLKTSARDKTHLYFSFMCFCLSVVAGIDIKCLYTSSVDQYLLYLRLTIVFLCFYFIFLNFFIAGFSKIKIRAFLYLITVCLVAIILGFIFFPYTLYFKSIAAMAPVKLSWGETIYTPVAEPSNWALLVYFAALTGLIYLITVTIALFKKKRRGRDAVALAFTVGIIIIANLRDVWVDASGRQSFYMIEFAFFFLVVLMGFRLSSQVIESGRIEKELTKTEKRWQTLLEQVELVVVDLDKDGNVNYVNPYYLKLTGFSEKDVLGQNWFHKFIPDDQGFGAEHVFRSVEKYKHYENPILTKGGEARIVAWSNVALQDAKERFIGTLSIGADVTEKLSSQNELKIAYQNVQELKTRLEEENIYLKEELSSDYNFEHIIGKSTALKYVLKRIEQVIDKDTNILLEGETGVGKELFASSIHYKSHRKDQPFIKVNCASIPTNLIESELFGHVKGAFTGAYSPRKGRFEIADGGTLFLDEIGELPLDLQPKLLRVLQDGEFEALGASKTNKADVRVIAATNRVLKEEVDAGRFREDLYYRLSVYPVSLPPLRQRHGDISLLVSHFVQYFANKHGKSIDQIPKPVMVSLESYSWPGNIREIQNIIERAVITTPANILHLQENLQQTATNESHPIHNTADDVTNLKEIEISHITMVLKKCDWRIEGEGGASLLLGLKPSTLRSRMKKYGIKRPA